MWRTCQDWWVTVQDWKDAGKSRILVSALFKYVTWMHGRLGWRSRTWGIMGMMARMPSRVIAVMTGFEFSGVNTPEGQRTGSLV